MENKDAFDLWWEWAEKPLDGPLTIDAEIHEAVMALPPDERRESRQRPCATVSGLAHCVPLGARTFPAFRRPQNRSARAGAR